jgi:hypothetical protein
MNLTFTICTGGTVDPWIEQMIYSIEKQNILNYEILILGETKITGKNTQVIDFDYQGRDRWVARKKNVLTQHAKYDNIVYLHDYMVLFDEWYAGLEHYLSKYGDNFQLLTNKIITLEGYRHSDWCIFPPDLLQARPDFKDTPAQWDVGLEYNVRGLNAIMHLAGNYWIGKKRFMLDNPYDETLDWWDGEDVEFVRRVRPLTEIKFNPYSAIYLLKPNKWAVNMMPPDVLESVLTYYKDTVHLRYEDE